MQGMFSRTLFLTLADGREFAIQFRTEPLDASEFNTAKEVLGCYVPNVQALPNEELQAVGAWACAIDKMPGQLWLLGVAGKGAEGRIAVNKSLGRVFSNCFIASQSHEALRPRLDELAQLRLWVAHYDMNEANVLIDDNFEVSALIDWELSTPLSFGFGFGRIHTIAGEYTDVEFWVPGEFEEAERGFWGEVFGGMSEDVGSLVESRLGLVRDAVLLATVLSCFFFENETIGVAQDTLKALPKMMTYRLPAIRGQDRSYQD